MPRPRFDRLSPRKQRRILEAAALEFARHGFTGASLNRIIDAAGISKGAAYYYFDDKADLFAAVLEHGWRTLMPRWPFTLDALTAATFWPEVERGYGELVARVRSAPWLVAVGQLVYARAPSPEIGGLVDRELEGARSGLRALVARGQALGVVRTDVPAELLIVVLTAALEAADRWVLDHPDTVSGEAAPVVPARLFDMLRRLVEPSGSGLAS